MRIHDLSDIHLEHGHYDYRPPKGGVDLVVIAGDLGAPMGTPNTPSIVVEKRVDKFLRACTAVAPVVFVPGNHDFMGREYLDRVKEFCSWMDRYPGLHVLMGQSVTIAGVKIAGATLWSDFSWCAVGMRELLTVPDFHHIQVVGQRLTPDKMAALHRQDRAALLNEIADGADVVVTHFLPCPESIHPRFARSTLNSYFCTDQRSVMHDAEGLGRAPRLWIHGHTHHPVDVQVGQTRVVCNPRGYPFEKSGYNSKLVIELPDALQSGNGTPSLQG